MPRLLTRALCLLAHTCFLAPLLPLQTRDAAYATNQTLCKAHTSECERVRCAVFDPSVGVPVCDLGSLGLCSSASLHRTLLDQLRMKAPA